MTIWKPTLKLLNWVPCVPWGLGQMQIRCCQMHTPHGLSEEYKLDGCRDGVLHLVILARLIKPDSFDYFLLTFAKSSFLLAYYFH